MHIRLINPNSTASMTAQALASALCVKHESTQVSAVNPVGTPASTATSSAFIDFDSINNSKGVATPIQTGWGQWGAPIGYYENFVVRVFSLNTASSYKINGRTITGEQNVGLENKKQVEYW